MKLQIHSIHFTADKKLLNFVQAKTDKLEKFFNHVIDGEVFLRLNNSGTKNKTVEIKLNIPGTQVFAKEVDSTFEAATDSAVKELEIQLKKRKEKLIKH